MPFYEYQCRACGAEVEVLQKITDAPLKKCPECGKSQLAKLVSAPVFRLKGSGWYETDFKTDKDNKRNLVETEKAETKSEDKSDAKPEAKADAKAETKAETKSESRTEAKPAAESRPAASRKAAPVKKAAKPAKAKAKAKSTGKGRR
jgi:putative FmdB family regulatory protein